MTINGCIAAAAAAAQHDYTLNFHKTCAFRPRQVQGDGMRVEGFNLAQASGVVSARAPNDTLLFGHLCFVLRDACGV